MDMISIFLVFIGGIVAGRTWDSMNVRGEEEHN